MGILDLFQGDDSRFEFVDDLLDTVKDEAIGAFNDRLVSGGITLDLSPLDQSTSFLESVKDSVETVTKGGRDRLLAEITAAVFPGGDGSESLENVFTKQDMEDIKDSIYLVNKCTTELAAHTFKMHEGVVDITDEIIKLTGNKFTISKVRSDYARRVQSLKFSIKHSLSLIVQILACKLNDAKEAAINGVISFGKNVLQSLLQVLIKSVVLL